MKDFIQKLQQFPKAWGKLQVTLEESPYCFREDGKPYYKVEPNHLRRMSWDYPWFEILEGFLNSFIESEGYSICLSKDWGYGNIPDFTCSVCGENGHHFGHSYSNDPVVAKQSAIIEAFKLIEQGL